MKVAVTGASGLIGSALVDHLRERGDEILTLVRRPTRTSYEVPWNPVAGDIDIDALAGTEAFVHLSGAGVGDHRWTAAYKRTLLDSRYLSTRTLSRAIAAMDPKPRVLVSGSAIGYYGDRGDEELTEASAPGVGFLPDVTLAWEGATEPASAAGVRVVHTRTSLVMARRGGAFGRLLPLVRLGLGGPLGSGRHWWSWMTLHDDVRARAFLLDHDVEGPVNLSSPQPLPQREVMAALGRAAHRPAMLPAPELALRLLLGEFADDILSSQRVLPAALTRAGFSFEHPDVDSAAGWLLRPVQRTSAGQD